MQIQLEKADVCGQEKVSIKEIEETNDTACAGFYMVSLVKKKLRAIL